jgi:hypothetical protein
MRDPPAIETARAPQARRRAPRRIAWVLATTLGLPYTATAQVTLDGTIGTAGAGPVAPGIDDLGQPATYLIHDGLGEQRGGNLFHSFDQFSVQLARASPAACAPTSTARCARRCRAPRST